MNAAFSNWPVRLTTFVGREQERAAVAVLLGDRRLVTLTGTGGVGKSRLALEIGRDLQGAYRDGGFFLQSSHPLSMLAPYHSASPKHSA